MFLDSKRYSECSQADSMTYVGGFSLLCRKGHNDSDASGPARVAFDDIAIVVPQTSPCGEMYTPTPTSTGCPTTAVTSCAACAPATPTATSQVLTSDDIDTYPSGSVPMPAHYEGFNFSPKATVVRSSGNNTFGSKRSDPNALSGMPYQGDGFDNSYAMSFSSELTAAFTIQGFYIAVFNISNPILAPSQSATLVLTLFGANRSFVYYAPSTVSIAIPVGEEMYKVYAGARPVLIKPNVSPGEVYPAASKQKLFVDAVVVASWSGTQGWLRRP
ncbi:hypothetical protein V1506DRAFT_509756 [Lipomyces tetrasporus]